MHSQSSTKVLKPEKSCGSSGSLWRTQSLATQLQGSLESSPSSSTEDCCPFIVGDLSPGLLHLDSKLLAPRMGPYKLQLSRQCRNSIYCPAVTWPTEGRACLSLRCSQKHFLCQSHESNTLLCYYHSGQDSGHGASRAQRHERTGWTVNHICLECHMVLAPEIQLQMPVRCG